MIKTNGLTKSFGALKALDNLTLEIGLFVIFIKITSARPR